MADEQGDGSPNKPGAQRPARRRPARTLIGMAAATGERSVLDLPQPATRAGASPATNDDEARATLVDDAGSSPAELEGPPTQIGAAPDELEGAPTQAAIVAPEPEPLEGPPTQLGARSTIEADPLPYELTMPAVEVPELEGAPRTSAPGELVVEPTAVVDPNAKSARQTYRVDVRSGVVELEPEAEDAPPPPRRARLGVLVAGVAAGLLLVAAGVVGLVVFVAGDDEVAAPAPRGPASASATQSEESASAPEPPAEPATDDASDPLEEPEPDEGAEDAAPAVGRVIPRAELEAFRLELPHLSRRTRRMSEAERRRQAVRLRALALRHYAEGRYAEAESAFREALEHVPRDPASFQGMARATAQEGRLPEALAWAKAAVEQSPRSGTAYRVLGDVWRQAGYPDEARAAYRRGLFRDPHDRWLRRRLAEVASD